MAASNRTAGHSQRNARWERVSAARTDGEWTIYCHGSGDVCTVGRLVEASRLTYSHDAAAAECTKSVNRILDRVAAENNDSGRCLRFVVTEYGPMLAWTRCDDQARQTGEERTTLDGDAASFYPALGLSVANREAQKGHWEKHDDGWLYCHAKKKGQYKDNLLRADNPSSVFDARLMECTDQINEVLQSCEAQQTDERLELCLLTTPEGLLLAWTRDAHSQDSAGPGAITEASREELVYEALGLARPGAGGPPWKVIIPAGAVAAGAGAVIIALAVALSGDDDSSSAGTTPSPTVVATRGAATARPTATAGAGTGVSPGESPTFLPAATATLERPPTEVPGPTSPVEPTSNLEPTLPPAATRTPNVPPQT